MEKDLYNILGIDRNASDRDIKSAYKALSKQYHPDRQAGKSDEEKKEAEEKFKEINHAYQILGDPDKKRNYDQFGSENGPGNMFNNGFNPFDFDPFMGGFNPFGNMGQRPRTVEKGKDIQITVNISIEELFTGATKKLKYNRPVRCVNCHGEGGSGVKMCSHCNGTGMVTERKSMGPNSWAITNSSCPKCKGTGKIVEHKCPTCHGDGFTKESTTVEVNIAPGIIHDNVIVKSGFGADAKSRNGTTGDLHVRVQYDFINDDRYELVVDRNGKVNVTEDIFIPYYDLMLGCTYTVNLPTGKTKDIFIQSCTKDFTKVNVYKGDQVLYNIVIHYLYPEKLSDDEYTHIKAIKDKFSK